MAAQPHAHAEHALGAFLRALDASDVAALEQFVAANFAEAALAEASAAERASMLAVANHAVRGIDVHEIDDATDAGVSALGTTRLTGEWYRVSIELAPGEPGKVAAARMRPASPPIHDASATPLGDGDRITQLRAFVDRLAEAEVFSGTLLVAKDGGELFAGAWGKANRRYGVPNDVETKFNLGSMNKMFTAVAIAQLVEAGALDWHTPIAAYIPDWPEDVASRVTIHHLLTHTSGIGDYFNQRYFAGHTNLRTVDDFLDLFRDDPLQFAPGERFAYSNGGFMLLGAIIERVTGQDFFAHVREHVYTPAGMSDTDAYEMDLPIPNLAIGYTQQDERGRFDPNAWRSNIYLHVVKGGPAGGGFSTVRDLLRFDRALRSGTLTSSANAETLWTGKVGTPFGSDSRYAYGFVEDVVRDQRVVGHSGGFAGINAQLDMYLDSGYTVAVMANVDPPVASHVALKVRELFSH